MRIVPPVASDGLWTPFASAAWPAPPPEPPLPVPVVLGPPHADRATVATAPSASAVNRRVLLISTFPTSRSARPGVEGVAQAVAEQVEREHGHEDRQARPQHEVRGD